MKGKPTISHHKPLSITVFNSIYYIALYFFSGYSGLYNNLVEINSKYMATRELNPIKPFIPTKEGLFWFQYLAVWRGLLQVFLR